MIEADPPINVTVAEREIFDALHRAVVVTDPHGRIQFWNAAAEALYGWTDQEVVGLSVIDVLAPEDELPANQAQLQAVASGHAVSGERTVTRRDGSRIRVLTFTRPVFDKFGTVKALVGSAEDVTAQRQAEQHARELTEHFRFAIQAGGLGTWRWDMATGETTWDERLEALFGLPPGGFDGSFESYTSRLHPADRERVLAAVEDAVATRSSYRVEHRVVWPDGSDHWIAAAGGVTLDEHDVVTGTIGCAMDVTERAQQDEERARLTAIALDAAASERVQRERLEFLSVVNEALNQSHSVAEIMDNVAAAAVPRLGDWCAIYVLPRDHATPDVAIAHIDPEMVAYAHQLQERFPYDPDAPTGIPEVIRTAATSFFPEITEDLIAELDVTDEGRAIVNQLALRSAIAVPLVKRNRVLGAIQFVMSSSSRRYTDDDVALAQTVAGRIASSIENARLNEQQRTIAQTLQRSLLPARLPDVPGADIAVRYWASGEGTDVGGDFYDVFALDAPDQWAIVIGDVCGTGPEAAALTGLARHSIRESAWHGDDPTQVLTALARAVDRSAPRSFCTAIYAQYDRRQRAAQLTIACGGHPLPVHVTSQGATTVGAPGTLLGMIPDPVFHPRTIAIAAGDVVVFYTDGATDQPPPHDLDEAAFVALIERCVADGRDAGTIADGIHASLEAVRPFDQRDDDIAILVVRFLADPS